jgi:hypothetical protein
VKTENGILFLGETRLTVRQPHNVWMKIGLVLPGLKLRASIQKNNFITEVMGEL